MLNNIGDSIYRRLDIRSAHVIHHLFLPDHDRNSSMFRNVYEMLSRKCRRFSLRFSLALAT